MGFASLSCVMWDKLFSYKRNIPSTVKMAGCWLQIGEHPVTCSYAANPLHSQSMFMSPVGWGFFPGFFFVHFASYCQFTFKIGSEALVFVWLVALFRMKGWRLGAVQNETYWKSVLFMLYLLLSHLFLNAPPLWVFSCLGWVLSKLMAWHNLYCPFLDSWFHKVRRWWWVAVL